MSSEKQSEPSSDNKRITSQGRRFSNQHRNLGRAPPAGDKYGLSSHDTGTTLVKTAGGLPVSSQSAQAAGLPNDGYSPPHHTNVLDETRSMRSNFNKIEIGDPPRIPRHHDSNTTPMRKRSLNGDDNRPATRLKPGGNDGRALLHHIQSYPPRHPVGQFHAQTGDQSQLISQQKQFHPPGPEQVRVKEEQQSPPVMRHQVDPNTLSSAFSQGSAAYRPPIPSNNNAIPASSLTRTRDTEDVVFLQPETKPITQEQLINEVKGIYAGLVMVEKKCAEICLQESQSATKLSDQQWQALIALHRTLLHEHHDFFLASQHPTASPALRRLAIKYAMPARMWRHGIHSFLELLRRRLPDSMEHMLSFVYLAYSMMALLKESVPTFIETWIECLGDLARYRMAIEESDLRDREIWAGVARMWYNKAADLSPDVGRIQHHLAVLARPNIVQQLFFYTKSLVSAIPFVNARESIMLLFNPLLEKVDTIQTRSPIPLESAMVTAAGIAFTRGSISSYTILMESAVSGLDGHIARTNSKFRISGPEIASAMIGGVMDFANENNQLWSKFRSHAEDIKATRGQEREGVDQSVYLAQDAIAKEASHREFWVGKGENDYATGFPRAARATKPESSACFTTSEQVEAYYLAAWYESTSIVASKIGDKNVIPYLHVTLAFIWSLTFIPGALFYLERSVPWIKLATFLNTLRRSGVIESDVESSEFPQAVSGTGKQLPEDFQMRGLVWSSYYFPVNFFNGHIVDEDERQLELPSHNAPRAGRCLWLGIRISTLHRYLKYDYRSKEFSTTALVRSWDSASLPDLFSTTRVIDTTTPLDSDTNMIDAPAG